MLPVLMLIDILKIKQIGVSETILHKARIPQIMLYNMIFPFLAEFYGNAFEQKLRNINTGISLNPWDLRNYLQTL